MAFRLYRTCFKPKPNIVFCISIIQDNICIFKHWCNRTLLADASLPQTDFGILGWSTKPVRRCFRHGRDEHDRSETSANAARRHAGDEDADGRKGLYGNNV